MKTTKKCFACGKKKPYLQLFLSYSGEWICNECNRRARYTDEELNKGGRT